MFLPNAGQFPTGLVEVPVRDFRLEVSDSPFASGKRGSGFHQHFFICLHPEADIQPDALSRPDACLPLEQAVSAEGAESGKILLVFHNEVPAIARRFAPALVDAVHGIIAVDAAVHRIQFDVSFALIAVRVDHEPGIAFILVSEAEDSGAGAGGHFCC